MNLKKMLSVFFLVVLLSPYTNSVIEFHKHKLNIKIKDRNVETQFMNPVKFEKFTSFFSDLNNGQYNTNYNTNKAHDPIKFIPDLKETALKLFEFDSKQNEVNAYDLSFFDNFFENLLEEAPSWTNLKANEYLS